MTDKQIIGGRGSGKPYTTLNTIIVMLENEKLKEALKAKEQECDQLKAERKILDDEAVVVEITMQQFKEYNQLKAENNELKYKAEFFENYNNAHIDKIMKFEKTLTEIKEIAEKQMEICSCKFDLNNYESGCRGCSSKDARVIAKQILQKISEVEDV